MLKLESKTVNSRINATVDKDLADCKYSGVAIRVLQNGETVAEAVKGYADIDTKRPVDGNTLFRLASMTKPVTAVAVLKAQEQGLLNISDSVRYYLPDFKEMYIAKKVTDADGKVSFVQGEKAQTTLRIHHMLSHVNGFGSGEYSYQFINGLTQTEHMRTLAAFADYTGKNMMLDFEPDTTWGYSGHAAFDICARIVELVSEMPFDEYIQKNIFDPIGVKDITFTPTEEQWSRMIRMHNRIDGKNVSDDSLGRTTFENFPITYFCAGAGLCGTLDSYMKFAEMLRQNGTIDGVTVLAPGSVEMMKSVWPLNNIGPSPVETWGLGVRVIKHGHPWLPEGLYGWSGAYGSHFWIDPANGITAVLMRNSRIDGGAGSVSSIELEKNVYEN